VATGENSSEKEGGFFGRFVSGFWSFMRTGFEFFGKVLEAVQADKLLAILWGFGVLFLVITVSVLVLAKDLQDWARFTVILTVLLLLTALFVFTIRRASQPNDDLTETIKVLRLRASFVDKSMEHAIDTLTARGRGGSGPFSNKAKAERVKSAREQFLSLHQTHIAALEQRAMLQSHEINRQIQVVLSGVNYIDMSDP
jgi:hypothetical protein